MKNRFLFIIAGLLIVAAVVVFMYNRTSTIKKELRDFAVADTALVDRIFMVDKMNQSVLLEREGDEWKVNGKYTARKDAIYVLLKTIARLDVKSPVPKSMMNTVISQMAARSVKTEVYKNGKRVKTFYVGGPTADHQGTFMMLENSSMPFIMHIPGFFGYLTTRFFVEEIMWRDQSVFRCPFKQLREIQVDYPSEPAKSYRIINEGPNQFTVLNGSQQMKMVDTIKTKEYLGRFAVVNYQTIINNFPEHRADSLDKAKPFAIIELTDILKRKTKLTLWRMPNHDKVMLYDGTVPEYNLDAVYGRREGDEVFLTVQFFVLDPLLKEPAYFMYNSQN
jgi:hypothetical protein